MKKKSLKKIFAIVAILSLIVSVNSCKQTTNKTVEIEKDSIVIIDDNDKTAELEKLIINRTEMSFADPENPTDFELKHTPEITISDETDEQEMGKITVKLGSNGIIHPETAEHWIDFIEIKIEYEDNNERVEIRKFENNENAGKATFSVPMAGIKKITATAGCNLHGVWKNEVVL